MECISPRSLPSVSVHVNMNKPAIGITIFAGTKRAFGSIKPLIYVKKLFTQHTVKYKLYPHIFFSLTIFFKIPGMPHKQAWNCSHDTFLKLHCEAGIPFFDWAHRLLSLSYTFTLNYWENLLIMYRNSETKRYSTNLATPHDNPTRIPFHTKKINKSMMVDKRKQVEQEIH